MKERAPSETDACLQAAGYGSGDDQLDPTGASGELMPSPESTGFFSVTEEDLMAADKHDRKVRRKHRRTGLKVLIVVLVLLLALVGGAVFAYTQGYGWPTQQATAEQLFDAKTAGTDISSLMVPGTSGTKVQETSDMLPSGATVQVEGIDRSMRDSTVYLTATLSQGGTQRYEVKMSRDGIGWKVSSVSLSYLSEDGSATSTN